MWLGCGSDVFSDVVEKSGTSQGKEVSSSLTKFQAPGFENSEAEKMHVHIPSQCHSILPLESLPSQGITPPGGGGGPTLDGL